MTNPASSEKIEAINNKFQHLPSLYPISNFSIYIRIQSISNTPSCIEKDVRYKYPPAQKRTKRLLYAVKAAQPKATIMSC